MPDGKVHVINIKELRTQRKNCWKKSRLNHSRNYTFGVLLINMKNVSGEPLIFLAVHVVSYGITRIYTCVFCRWSTYYENLEPRLDPGK